MARLRAGARTCPRTKCDLSSALKFQKENEDLKLSLMEKQKSWDSRESELQECIASLTLTNEKLMKVLQEESEKHSLKELEYQSAISNITDNLASSEKEKSLWEERCRRMETEISESSKFTSEELRQVKEENSRLTAILKERGELLPLRRLTYIAWD